MIWKETDFLPIFISFLSFYTKPEASQTCGRAGMHHMNQPSHALTSWFMVSVFCSMRPVGGYIILVHRFFSFYFASPPDTENTSYTKETPPLTPSSPNFFFPAIFNPLTTQAGQSMLRRPLVYRHFTRWHFTSPLACPASVSIYPTLGQPAPWRE